MTFEKFLEGIQQSLEDAKDGNMPLGLFGSAMLEKVPFLLVAVSELEARRRFDEAYENELLRGGSKKDTELAEIRQADRTVATNYSAEKISIML